MLYILQVIVYTGLMLLIYLLLLRDKPMHRFNRAYILASTVLPLVLPLLKLPEMLRPQQSAPAVLNNLLPEVIIGNRAEATNYVLPTWLVAATVLYLAVVMVFFFTRVWSYIKLRRLINSSDKEDRNGYILLKQTGYGPGSWGRYIFLPEGDVDSTIIRHEQVHIELRHSLDIIFLNIVQAVMWPNIFLHLLKKELVQVHEFQADAAVNMEATDYSELLLSSVFKTGKLDLTHTFIDHPIKRRIMMLHKNRATGKLRGIAASVLVTALLAGIVTMQSCEREKAETKVEATNEVLNITAKMPDPGFNIYQFMAETVKFPEEAEKNGIQGRVLIRFVVGKDGKVRDAVVANKEVDPLLAEAALNAVSKMPDWTPGEDSMGNKVSVYYTLPVTFKLDKEDANKSSFKELTNEEYEEKMEDIQRVLKEKKAEALAKGHEMREVKDGETDMVVSQVYTMLSNAVKGYKLQDITPDRNGDETYKLVSTNLSPEEIDYKLHNGGLIVQMDKNSGVEQSKEAKEARALLDRYNNKNK